MTAQRNVIFVGGVESGKSNYLFRTWIAIERERGALIKDGLPSDLEYLHEGASVLLDGNFAAHTSRDTQKTCEIPVADRNMPRSTSRLIIPDASGEIWLDLYEKREWPTAWDTLITPHCGFVLLVRAGSPHNVPAFDWITCERLYGATVSAQPTDTPTQVILVDWLQILRSIVDRRTGRSYVPRLSVVVSAWDNVPSDRQHGPPQDYLDIEFPLFSEFIQSGAHGFNARIFGLSIVGGDLARDAEFRQQFRHQDPATLGYVVSQSGKTLDRSNDVLRPIYWALGIDE